MKKSNKKDWTFNAGPDIPAESVPASRQEVTRDVIKCMRSAAKKEKKLAQNGLTFVKSNHITKEQAEQEVTDYHQPSKKVCFIDGGRPADSYPPAPGEIEKNMLDGFKKRGW